MKVTYQKQVLTADLISHVASNLVKEKKEKEEKEKPKAFLTSDTKDFIKKMIPNTVQMLYLKNEVADYEKKNMKMLKKIYNVFPIDQVEAMDKENCVSKLGFQFSYLVLHGDKYRKLQGEKGKEVEDLNETEEGKVLKMNKTEERKDLQMNQKEEGQELKKQATGEREDLKLNETEEGEDLKKQATGEKEDLKMNKTEEGEELKEVVKKEGEEQGNVDEEEELNPIAEVIVKGETFHLYKLFYIDRGNKTLFNKGTVNVIMDFFTDYVAKAMDEPEDKDDPMWQLMRTCIQTKLNNAATALESALKKNRIAKAVLKENRRTEAEIEFGNIWNNLHGNKHKNKKTPKILLQKKGEAKEKKQRNDKTNNKKRKRSEGEEDEEEVKENKKKNKKAKKEDKKTSEGEKESRKKKKAEKEDKESSDEEEGEEKASAEEESSEEGEEEEKASVEKEERREENEKQKKKKAPKKVSKKEEKEKPTKKTTTKKAQKK